MRSPTSSTRSPPPGCVSGWVTIGAQIDRVPTAEDAQIWRGTLPKLVLSVRVAIDSTGACRRKRVTDLYT